MKEGKETGVAGENPWRASFRNAIYYSWKIQAKSGV